MKNRILIGCLSGWQYPKRRKRVLDTWMRDVEIIRATHDPQDAKPIIDAVLLMGVLKAITFERIGEYLIQPCSNEYQHLPQRTRLFCIWALELPWWDYVFKTDDDTRLDVNRLLRYETHGRDYIGPEWRPGVGYASGNGYLLSRKAAEVVATTMTETEGFEWEGTAWNGAEDVMVGQRLGQAGISLTVDNDHFKVLTPFGQAPGPDNRWIYCSPKGREPE